MSKLSAFIANFRPAGGTPPKGAWVLLFVLFALVRGIQIATFDRVHQFYHHEMVVNQFLIADALWSGHRISYDRALKKVLLDESERQQRTIPLEEIAEYYGPDRKFTRFPQMDVPGYGYLIYWTSLLAGRLTSHGAFALQIAAEAIFYGLMIQTLFVLFGTLYGSAFGVAYLVFFPFNQIYAAQPMRDSFGLLIYGLGTAGLVSFFVSARSVREALIRLLAAFGLAGALLWIRPLPYYYFYIVCLLPMLATRWSWKIRAVGCLVVVGLPILIFKLPFGYYSSHYYGPEPNTFLGPGLWQGLGMVNDSRYEFVYGDRDLLRWARKRLGDDSIEFGTPRVNQLALQYSLDVLRNDPVLYVRAVKVRLNKMWEKPLHFDTGFLLRNEGETGLNRKDFAKAFPVHFYHHEVLKYGQYFFWISLPSLFLFFLFHWIRRAFSISILGCMIILAAPLIYHLAHALLYVFEMRHFLAGAWVVCLGPALWVGLLGDGIAAAVRFVRGHFHEAA